MTWGVVRQTVSGDDVNRIKHMRPHNECLGGRIKQGIQQLETQPGCEETQEESIRIGLESVVANGVAIPRERCSIGLRSGAYGALTGHMSEPPENDWESYYAGE
ncbi:hypothetical protein TNCV_929421 [Trichonephila clavipes]|nr:hypothetical protein TNCV_929421 [Trichonephila clavipes]